MVGAKIFRSPAFWIIAAIVVVGGGIAAAVFFGFQALGPKMASSRLFAEQALSAISAGNWDQQTLKTYAMPEYAALDEAKGGPQRYRTLGAMQGAPSCTTTKVSVGSKGTTATVDCAATFAIGKTNIVVNLRDPGAGWLISGLEVKL